MARIRNIKPEFFEDRKIGLLTHSERLFYIGLWCFMDRNGIVECDEVIFKKNLFYYDSKIKESDIEKFISELVKLGLLIKFEYETKNYLYCVAFKKHQYISYREKPKYPKLLDYLKSTILVSYQSDTSLIPVQDDLGHMTNDIGHMTYDQSNYIENKSQVIAEEFPLEFKEIKTTLEEKRIKGKVLAGWLDCFGQESEWIISEIRKAIAWENANPRKKKKDFVRFMTNWLIRAWDKRTLKFDKPNINVNNIKFK